MDTDSKRGPQIGGAECQVAKLGVMGECQLPL